MIFDSLSRIIIRASPQSRSSAKIDFLNADCMTHVIPRTSVRLSRPKIRSNVSLRFSQSWRGAAFLCLAATVCCGFASGENPLRATHCWWAGLQVGQPLAFTVDYQSSAYTSLHGAMGVHFNGSASDQFLDAFGGSRSSDSGAFNLDFLVHMSSVNVRDEASGWAWFTQNLRKQSGPPLYVGVGARRLIAGNPEYGLRFPVGIEGYYLSQIRVYAEIAPIIDLGNAHGFYMDGVFGVSLRLPSRSLTK